VSARAQRGDDAGLVLGSAAREDGGATGGVGEFRVGEAVDAVGREHLVGIEGEVAAGAGRGARVVAGEDLDGDAAVGEDAQGFPGGRGERVAPRDEAGEGQAAFVGRGVATVAGRAFHGGDREQPQTTGRLAFGESEEPCRLAVVQRTAPEYVFHGPVGPVLPGGAQHTADRDQGQDHAGGAPCGHGGRHQPEAQQHRGERIAQTPHEPERPGRGAPRRHRVLAPPG